MKRIMAGLLVFALIACSVVAVTTIADEEADATDGTVEYSKEFKTNEKESITISTNESSFYVDPKHGSISVGWSYQDNGWKNLTISEEFAIGDWKYSLEKSGSGQYRLWMDTNKTPAETELHLKYVITLTTTENVSTDVGSMEIVVKISKTGSTLPDHLKDNSYRFTVNTVISKDNDSKIDSYDADGKELNSAVYRWFAYSLPEGISVTTDGYLTGMPKAVADEKTYEIYAEDSFGNVGKYQVTIEVVQRDSDELPYYVHRGSTDNFNPNNELANPKVSAVQKGDVVYLVLVTELAEKNDAEVWVVGNNDGENYKQKLEYTDINVGTMGEYRCYQIPTGLVGECGIVIKSSDHITTTTLYVLPQLDVVIAGIGVSSSSTSDGGSS